MPALEHIASDCEDKCPTLSSFSWATYMPDPPMTDVTYKLIYSLYVSFKSPERPERSFFLLFYMQVSWGPSVFSS